jgi:hypothetical protein
MAGWNGIIRQLANQPRALLVFLSFLMVVTSTISPSKSGDLYKCAGSEWKTQAVVGNDEPEAVGGHKVEGTGEYTGGGVGVETGGGGATIG